MKNTIVVIGGGASGLVAGIIAKRRLLKNNDNSDVVILEQMDVLGKKILATGNGRCNLLNENITSDNYNSSAEGLIKSIFSLCGGDNIVEFFNSIGVLVRSDSYGRIYPVTANASTIREALISEVNRLGISVHTSCKAADIKKAGNKYKIISSSEEFIADKVIIAAGGKSQKSLGSDGSFYKVLKSLGHSLTDLLPSLVQIKVKEKYIGHLKGVRVYAEVTLKEDDKIIRMETGEVQFTENSLSGIVIFNMSRFIKKGRYFVHIDLLEGYNKEMLKDHLIKIKTSTEGLKIGEVLNGMLNKKISREVLKNINIKPEDSFKTLSDKQIDLVISEIKGLRFEVSGLESFDKSQVTSGGIKASEIDNKTLESKLNKGMYITGEILDVDGECGGYNLAFAWASGYVAGISAAGSILNKS